MDEVTVLLSLDVTIYLPHLLLDLRLALVVLQCNLPEDMLAHVVLPTVEVINGIFVEYEDGEERGGDVADEVKIKQDSPVCKLSVYDGNPHLCASRSSITQKVRDEPKERNRLIDLLLQESCAEYQKVEVDSLACEATDGL